GTTRGGVEVLGGLDLARQTDARVVVCVGNPRDVTVRRRVVRRLDLPAERYATVVHPSVETGPGCTVGPGSVLLAYAVLTEGVAGRDPTGGPAGRARRGRRRGGRRVRARHRADRVHRRRRGGRVRAGVRRLLRGGALRGGGERYRRGGAGAARGRRRSG